MGHYEDELKRLKSLGIPLTPTQQSRVDTMVDDPPGVNKGPYSRRAAGMGAFAASSVGIYFLLAATGNLEWLRSPTPPVKTATPFTSPEQTKRINNPPKPSVPPQFGQQTKAFEVQVAALYERYPAASNMDQAERTQATKRLAQEIASQPANAGRYGDVRHAPTNNYITIATAPARSDGSIYSFMCAQDNQGVTALVRAKTTPAGEDYSVTLQQSFFGKHETDGRPLTEEFSRARSCSAALGQIKQKYGNLIEFSHPHFGVAR